MYNLIYSALTRYESVGLFGKRIDADSDAFERSFAGNEFPELWFELPLLGDAWYDLHVLTSRSAIDPDTQLPERIFHPEIFRWFSKSAGARQLAMSHDLSKGIYDNPAVQLLINGRVASVGYDFLAESGNAATASAYKVFRDRITKEWFACYLGTFPERDDVNLRVECIPVEGLQKVYSTDADVLRRDLSMSGFEISDEMLKLIMFMADQPVGIEFQFNVDKDGSAQPVLGVSLRFSMPNEKSPHRVFSADNKNVSNLMNVLTSAGLCDDRWRLLPGCAFAKSLTSGGRSVCFGGYAAFIKVRMTFDKLIDAKAYIVANMYR